MALELEFYGHNVSLFGPDVALTGDPGEDNKAVEDAGYLAGVLVKVGASTLGIDVASLQLMESADDPALCLGAIVTEPGEFASAIGPGGSNRITVARGFWVGRLVGSGYDETQTYAEGELLYVGAGGVYTNVVSISAKPVGIVLHAPTVAEPFLRVASLI